MPIVENDPWRQQYFKGVVCPDDVTILTADALANDQHRKEGSNL